MSNHAILSPSGASRWLTCTPSARMEELFEDKSSEFAAEGSLAHALCELGLRAQYGLIDNDEARELDLDLKSSPLYSPDMSDYVSDYIEYVINEFEECKKTTKDALLFIEKKLDLTRYVPEGFGTGDAIIISNGTMRIIDLKYGKGVKVSAVENKQMMLYTLGALDEFDFIYDIRKVIMTVYQPRMYNISDYEMDSQDLYDWANTVLKPKATLAFNGHGDFVPGDHCRFCKAKATCKALAEENLAIASYDFLQAELLSDSDISDILRRADLFKNWINSVEEYAFKQALNGRKWDGYKLVEGRSVRTLTNQPEAVNRLVSKGFPEEVLYEKKFLSITELEKVVTKKAFSEILGDLIYKPEGKPTLVPDTDKRPEWNRASSAEDDFKDLV